MESLTNNKQFNLMASSYNEVKGQKYNFAVLPWGATESHNYHLPYLTSSYLTLNIAVDAVSKTYAQEEIKGMVLPPIHLGSQSLIQREQPFCIHARYETQKAILSDIVESLNYQRINKLVILNGHKGNNFKNMIRDLSIDYPNFLIIYCDWYSILSHAGQFEEGNLEHTNDIETSVMMYYHPNMVDLDTSKENPNKIAKAKPFRDGVAWLPHSNKLPSESGVDRTLNPTEEKGKSYAESVSLKLVELFTELTRDDLY